MDIVPIDLSGAALGARERLAAFSTATATANAGGRSSRAGTAAADAAREAIFADALLAAMHARFEELRGIAK